MSIPEEFIITRHGKQFVLYAGLLNEAHNQGLSSIETELLPGGIPTPENNFTAIARAVIEMETDDEHSTVKRHFKRVFTGIGDANPKNVGPNIVPHIIRMAETRAKARALRDATNVGMTALEELSEASESSEASSEGSEGRDTAAVLSRVQQGQRQASRAWRASNHGSTERRDPTPKQLNYLRRLIDDTVEGGDAKFKELAGKPVEELDRNGVSEWIGKLSGKGG